MAYPRKTPAAQFHVDCSPEAKSRFAALHEAFGSKRGRRPSRRSFSRCRSQTRSTRRFSSASKPSSIAFSKTSTAYEDGNDFRAQDHVAKPPRSRISRRNFQPESFRAPGARWRPEKNPPAPAIRRLRLEGNTWPGSCGRILAPSDSRQPRRYPHGTVATDQRRTQEADFGGVVRAHPKISDLLEKSRRSASPCFLDVPRDAIPTPFGDAAEPTRRCGSTANANDSCPCRVS